jgi:TfoX/Sxy family transcriptional regulator of competence genes
MAYDEHTADRFRKALAGLEGISEKKMMGGVCFLLNGNMVGGADRPKDGEPRFMFRAGKDNVDAATALPGAQPMEMGTRKMRGFFFVQETSCDDSALKAWVSLCVSFAASLPPK